MSGRWMCSRATTQGWWSRRSSSRAKMNSSKSRHGPARRSRTIRVSFSSVWCCSCSWCGGIVDGRLHLRVRCACAMRISTGRLISWSRPYLAPAEIVRVVSHPSLSCVSHGHLRCDACNGDARFTLYARRPAPPVLRYLILLLLSALLAACTLAETDALRFGLSRAPGTLDPRFAAGAAAARGARRGGRRRGGGERAQRPV